MNGTAVVHEEEYIPSKRAAELSGYTQDYIGQLARAGAIDAQRIGGLWHVRLESILAHKEKADAYIPVPPGRPDVANNTHVDNVISLDGKTYISSARAAAVTGYNQDYVTQLAREGKVVSRQIGNRWYVAQDGVIAHKREKDALLAAVQAKSVGIRDQFTPQKIQENTLQDTKELEHEPFYTYTSDTRPLIPALPEYPIQKTDQIPTRSPIPIHVHTNTADADVATYAKPRPYHHFEPIRHTSRQPTTRMLGPVAVTTLVALTIVAVIGVGLGRFSFGGVLTQATGASTVLQKESLVANASEVLDQLGSLLERLFGKPQVYVR